jgi:Protein of unknown function (DUF1153)
MTEHALSRAETAGDNTPATAANGGSDVAPRSLDHLPPPGTKRWVIRRKAAVVAAVRNGLLTLEDACKRYNLSVEEFLSWQRLIERHGLPGLRATRLQDYRGPATGT